MSDRAYWWLLGVVVIALMILSGILRSVRALMRGRHYLGARHYPAWAPKILWHRFSHWAIGPLLGCSCSRCFKSRWRIAYSNSVIDRFVKNERRVRHVEDELQRLLPNYKRSLP